MKTAIMALLLAQAGVCAAAQAQVQEPACSWLMTEAECAQHRQTLAGLQDSTARLAYLEQHLNLLSEREVMCGCIGGQRQVMARARAQYR